MFELQCDVYATYCSMLDSSVMFMLLTVLCLDSNVMFMLLTALCLDSSAMFMLLTALCLDSSVMFMLLTALCLDSSVMFMLLTALCLDSSVMFMLLTALCLDSSVMFMLLTALCLDSSVMLSRLFMFTFPTSVRISTPIGPSTRNVLVGDSNLQPQRNNNLQITVIRITVLTENISQSIFIEELKKDTPYLAKAELFWFRPQFTNFHDIQNKLQKCFYKKYVW